MPAYLSPIGNDQQADANGVPVSGALIATYVAGTTTPVVTYTDAAGTSPQANPVVCNAAGFPASPIFLPAGVAVKMVFTTSVATGSVPYRPAVDNIQGVNDPSFATTVSEWTAYSGTPTYISATSFSITGDQTNTFQVLRKLKTTNTGGTVYSRISASSFGAGITTVTVVNLSGALDAGLSAVSYGLLSATNPSIPESPAGALLRVGTTGTVLQMVAFTDAGTTTANAALTSVTLAAKSITPKSSNSTIHVRCTFTGQANAAGAGTNAAAGFRLYNNTGAADIGIGTQGLGVASGSGTNSTNTAPGCVEATLTNSGTTAIAFVLRAQYTVAATTVGATNQQWTITEIQN